MSDQYDRAFDDACEEYNTDSPTQEQIEDMVVRNIEKTTDEAMNYYDQNGGN